MATLCSSGSSEKAEKYLNWFQVLLSPLHVSCILYNGQIFRHSAQCNCAFCSAFPIKFFGVKTGSTVSQCMSGRTSAWLSGNVATLYTLGTLGSSTECKDNVAYVVQSTSTHVQLVVLPCTCGCNMRVNNSARPGHVRKSILGSRSWVFCTHMNC